MKDNTATLQIYPEIRIGQSIFAACDLVDEDLVDTIWRELDGRISREHVWQTACRVAERYHDASITTFIPIFIRRQTMEILAR